MGMNQSYGGAASPLRKLSWPPKITSPEQLVSEPFGYPSLSPVPRDVHCMSTAQGQAKVLEATGSARIVLVDHAGRRQLNSSISSPTPLGSASWNQIAPVPQAGCVPEMQWANTATEQGVN